jgi:hypothetical protein
MTLLALALAAPLAGQAGPDRVDHDAIYKIKEEGFQRSDVMEIAGVLTDVHGPRLTNSPNFAQAAAWAMKKMTDWGLVNVKLEPWGTFGPGWSNQLTSIRAVSPQAYPIIGYSKAWSAGTPGAIAGEAVLMKMDPRATDLSYLEPYRGKLRGRIVLLGEPRELKTIDEAPSKRYSAEQLSELTRETAHRARAGYRPPTREARELIRKRLQFLREEGALATVDAGWYGDGGTVFVGGVTPRDPKDPAYVAIPQLTIAAEHYGRMARTLARGIPVRLEIEVANTFHDTDATGYNVVGEIPGTDKADEVVMIGAHFDSWHTGTGATDNAAGSAVMLEAMRIIKAAGLRPRRTIRIALWSGEEQGLLGSRAYVKQHFGDPETMALKPEHGRFAAYFNVDNGTGAIRGVYLQGNEAVGSVFRTWMEPFRSLGMDTLSIRDTGGTDHLAFDGVGLPGFQFIQDPVEYDSRTHHSNMDVYERMQAPDMKQNAVIVAAFAYHAAMRDETLPRKPLPKPRAPERPTTTAAGAASR